MFTRKTIVFTQLIRICDLVRTYLRELHKIPPLIVNLGYQLWKGNHDFFFLCFDPTVSKVLLEEVWLEKSTIIYGETHMINMVQMETTKQVLEPKKKVFYFIFS